MWAEIHCSRWRRQRTWEWYSRVMDVGTLIHGLVKQTQLCVSCIALWSQNGRFQTSQSFQLLNRSLFRCSPVVMNFRWPMKKYCQKNKRQWWDICEELSMWHFVTKSTDLKCVMPGMSELIFKVLIMNSFSKCSAVPLFQCLRNCSLRS